MEEVLTGGLIDVLIYFVLLNPLSTLVRDYVTADDRPTCLLSVTIRVQPYHSVASSGSYSRHLRIQTNPSFERHIVPSQIPIVVLPYRPTRSRRSHWGSGSGHEFRIRSPVSSYALPS